MSTFLAGAELRDILCSLWRHLTVHAILGALSTELSWQRRVQPRSSITLSPKARRLQGEFVVRADKAQHRQSTFSCYLACLTQVPRHESRACYLRALSRRQQCFKGTICMQYTLQVAGLGPSGQGTGCLVLGREAELSCLHGSLRTSLHRIRRWVVTGR